MPTALDPAYRFATNVFDTDGTDTVYNISFTMGYLNPRDVVALSGVEDAESGLLDDPVTHVVTFIDNPAGTRVVVSPIPAAGRKLILMRSTDVSALLVKFAEDKLLTGRNLDLSATQMLMAIQEIVDGLRANSLLVGQQVSTVIDMNKLINEVYTQVIELLASGGIVSVNPRVWRGEWSGDTSDDTDFPMAGADISGAGFYDTYVDGVGIEPDVGYEIIMGDTTADTTIRFASAHPGKSWFTVLRGYARPYSGPPPVSEADLRLAIIDSDGPVFNATVTSERGLVRCNSSTGTEVRVQAIPAVGPSETKLGSGAYMSFVQKGGPVTLVATPGVTLNVPAGCLPKTRGVNCTVSITCEFGDGNVWLLSGDLAKE